MSREKQIPPQPQGGESHQERFIELARKVANTTPEQYRKFAEEEKADKKKPEQPA